MSSTNQVFSNVLNSETERGTVVTRGQEEGWEWGLSALWVELQRGDEMEMPWRWLAVTAAQCEWTPRQWPVQNGYSDKFYGVCI